jgi:hypothetical protein
MSETFKRLLISMLAEEMGAITCQLFLDEKIVCLFEILWCLLVGHLASIRQAKSQLEDINFG